MNNNAAPGGNTPQRPLCPAHNAMFQHCEETSQARQLESLTNQMAERDQRIVNLTEEVGDLTVYTENLRDDITDRDQALRSLTRQFDERTYQMESLERQLAGNRDDALLQQLADRDRQIEDLTRQLEEQELKRCVAHEHVRAQLRPVRNQIRAFEAKVDEGMAGQKAEMAELHKQVAQMREAREKAMAPI